MKNFYLASVITAAALQFASTADAATIRFNFDTEATYSQTLANNSGWQNEGLFGIAVVRGLNTAVIGYLDIERIAGQIDRVINYSFNVVTPHGLAPGLAFGSPFWQTQLSSTVDLSPGGSGAGVQNPAGAIINIYQTMMFDPFYGPMAFANQSPTPRYDPAIRQDYPFQQRILISAVPGAGPDGGASFAITRAEFNCFEYPSGGGGANGCNGYWGSNFGVWDGSTGLASSFGAVPVSAVPLPAGFPLLLAGLGALFVMARRTKAVA